MCSKFDFIMQKDRERQHLRKPSNVSRNMTFNLWFLFNWPFPEITLVRLGTKASKGEHLGLLMQDIFTVRTPFLLLGRQCKNWMPFLVPNSRHTTGITHSASTVIPEGQMASLLLAPALRLQYSKF